MDAEGFEVDTATAALEVGNKQQAFAAVLHLDHEACEESFFGIDVVHAAEAQHRFGGTAAAAVVVADDARDVGGFAHPFEAFFMGGGLEKIFRDLPWLESGPCGFVGALRVSLRAVDLQRLIR